MSAELPSASMTRRRALQNALLSPILAAEGTRLTLSSGSCAAASSTPPLPDHVSLETLRAISKGLAWLALRQQDDGGFGVAASYARNVGVCALAGTALLAVGGGRGSYSTIVRRCTDYLLSRARPDGFIIEADVKTHAPMYGHGYATMYLGQVYGEDRRPELREKLVRAVALIVEKQGDHGAWRYMPSPEDADVSVTTCQMMAIYSARQAGIAVPDATIAKGIAYLRRCQNEDGGFRYRLIDPPESLFPRSAAAVATLHAFGLGDDDVVRRGREYLAKIESAGRSRPADYFFYGSYYAAHAAWLAGAEAWSHWFPTARDELLRIQSADGSWHDPNIGDEYATAMSLITLQFPFDCVPMFAR